MNRSNNYENTNILILLNNFIINIMNDKNLFNNIEYQNIKKINNSCKIDYENDCQTTITNKSNIQHYGLYI